MTLASIHEVCVVILGINFVNNTGQQNLTFFLSHELQYVNLEVLFMLNSDMYAEFFYQAEFQRYRGLYLCKMVLFLLMKQAETCVKNVEAYDFRR